LNHDHAPGRSCPKCWAELKTPLFCESCHELLAPTDRPSPFDALGLSTAYPVNRMELRKRLLQLSRRLHPDFHGSASQETRARAERNTAELNAAFELLDDDCRRADWLVRSLGGPGQDEERQMPAAFLSEVLEWSETIEEARNAAPGSPERAALGPLETSLREQRARTMESISDSLTPLPHTNAPELVEIRRSLNAVRYLDRALGEIAELRLSEASTSR